MTSVSTDKLEAVVLSRAVDALETAVLSGVMESDAVCEVLGAVRSPVELAVSTEDEAS